MIHNIARQCSKTFALFNPAKNSNNTHSQAITTPMLQFNCAYKFSTEQKTQKPKRQQPLSDAFSPIDYYRNTIRRVNIRSNGRGKFSSYGLQKIVNMSSTEEHAKIMFEAYFNYMGHFMLIPNKIVDSLVVKAIHIGNQVDKVLEIFSHHNYLAYFPHYQATNTVIRKLAKAQDQQNLEKMFRILIRSPLIKINTKIVDTLVSLASAEECDANTREYVLKVLLFRRKLIDGINQEDLLARVATLLQKIETGPFQPKPMISQSINELLAETPASTEETVNKLILTSTFGMIDECGFLLAQEQQEIGTQYDRFFDYSLKLYQRSSQEVNYGTLLKDALAEAKLSIGVSEKLEKLVNGTSE